MTNLKQGNKPQYRLFCSTQDENTERNCAKNSRTLIHTVKNTPTHPPTLAISAHKAINTQTLKLIL